MTRRRGPSPGAAAFAASLAVAILCAAPAHAQTYTWLSTATGTVFSESNNWSPGFTLPTTGRLWLATGTTGTANRPTLTASATAGGLIFGDATTVSRFNFEFNSSDPAAVLSLTGTQPIASVVSSTITTAVIGTNIQFLRTGTQTVQSTRLLTLSGTLSGGDANGRLAFSGDAAGLFIPNPGNTFASPVSFEAATASANYGSVTVASIGMAGSPSSLGTSGTVQLGGQAYILLSSTAPAQTSDKAFELFLPAGRATAGVFGINNGNDTGVMPSRSMLNLTGPIRTLPVSGPIFQSPVSGIRCGGFVTSKWLAVRVE